MFTNIKKIFFAFFILGITSQASAQCAMCRAVLESEDSGVTAQAVNDGIVYLMVFPYILVAFVGFVVYRIMNKKNTEKEA